MNRARQNHEDELYALRKDVEKVESENVALLFKINTSMKMKKRTSLIERIYYNCVLPIIIIGQLFMERTKQAAEEEG